MGEKRKAQKSELVNLGDAVDKLRSELIKAWQNAEKKDHKLKFNVKEIELELHTVLQDSTEVGGGLDLKVFKMGGKQTDTDARTQLIRLKLELDSSGLTGNESQGNQLPIAGKVDEVIK